VVCATKRQQEQIKSTQILLLCAVLMIKLLFKLSWEMTTGLDKSIIHFLWIKLVSQKLFYHHENDKVILILVTQKHWLTSLKLIGDGERRLRNNNQNIIGNGIKSIWVLMLKTCKYLLLSFGQIILVINRRSVINLIQFHEMIELIQTI
jgi:hypothetical protein